MELPSHEHCLMNNDYQIYDEQIEYELKSGDK